MHPALTVPEIEQQYPAEWVLVANIRTNDQLEVQSGEVLAHNIDRDEVYRQAIALHPRRFAVLYTGKMPPNTAIVL